MLICSLERIVPAVGTSREDGDNHVNHASYFQTSKVKPPQAGIRYVSSGFDSNRNGIHIEMKEKARERENKEKKIFLIMHVRSGHQERIKITTKPNNQ